MSSRHLFRHADPKRVRSFAVDSAEVIEIGDLCWLNTDDVRAASQITWNTNLATTQADFKAAFVGVAMTASASGETDPVQVAGAGVFEMDSPAATYEIGDSVGPDKDTGNALLDQTVETAVAASSCMRVYKRYASNTTRVLVEIFPYIREV
jgi:hypothetical protein